MENNVNLLHIGMFLHYIVLVWVIFVFTMFPFVCNSLLPCSHRKTSMTPKPMLVTGQKVFITSVANVAATSNELQNTYIIGHIRVLLNQ